MILSLTNYTTVLTKALLKQSALCVVRECDESESGHYQAYVDEGDDSFDVSLVLDRQGVVQEHLCDCGTTNCCKHRTALLAHLASGSTRKKPAGKGKRSQTDDLLDTIEADALRQWVAGLLRQNKELELAFVQQFGPTQQSFTVPDVEALTRQAIKAVIKTRRKADASEVKKITDLWRSLHEPVVAFYLADVSDKDGWAAYHALFEGCLALPQQAGSGSTRIGRYVQVQLQRTAEAVASLHDEGAFIRATGFFLEHLYGRYGDVRMHYLQHLESILSIASEPRKLLLVQQLADAYAQADKVQIYNGVAFTKAVFRMVKLYGSFAQLYHIFQPIAYDNDFNKELIGMLVDAGHLDLAERYCKQLIKHNTKEVYNLPYLLTLQQISRLRHDDKSLVAITRVLLPHTFNFDDYLLVAQQMMPAEAKKQWRNQLLLAARAQAHNRKAQDFLYRVLHHEGAHGKMIETLHTHTPYEVILAFFAPMFHTDRHKLLQALLAKNDELGWHMSEEDPEQDEVVFAALGEQMQRYYTAMELEAAFLKNAANHRYHRANRFLLYLQHQRSFQS